MSNSPLATYTRLSQNKTSPRHGTINLITIHCIVGQCTAKAGCDYFANASVRASANYVVGKDGSIGLCVEEKDRAWTSGGKLKVNGITGSMNDHNAITIEVASDTTAPYAVTDAAYRALIDLVADICKRNGIKQLKWKADKTLVGKPDEQNMTVHRWFANKSCPGDYLYNRHGEIAAEVNQRLSAPATGGEASEPTPVQNGAQELAVGTVVSFTGTKHYVSSNAVNGKACKPGKATITAMAKSGKHPYHLIHTDKTSDVYGWVDAADIRLEGTTITVGSKVRVNKGAKTYTGGSLASFVYSTVYTVLRMNGSRVVIGLNGEVTAAMNIKDLTLV